MNETNFSIYSYIKKCNLENTFTIFEDIFLNKNTLESIRLATSGYYDDREYCPENFKIPTKSDYESIISELGSNAYSIFLVESFVISSGGSFDSGQKGNEKIIFIRKRIIIGLE